MLFVEDMVKKQGLKSIRLDTYGGNYIMRKFLIDKMKYKELDSFEGVDPCYLVPKKNEFFCYEKIIKWPGLIYNLLLNE